MYPTPYETENAYPSQPGFGESMSAEPTTTNDYVETSEGPVPTIYNPTYTPSEGPAAATAPAATTEEPGAVPTETGSSGSSGSSGSNSSGSSGSSGAGRNALGVAAMVAGVVAAVAIAL